MGIKKIEDRSKKYKLRRETPMQNYLVEVEMQNYRGEMPIRFCVEYSLHLSRPGSPSPNQGILRKRSKNKQRKRGIDYILCRASQWRMSRVPIRLG